jgi:outer membrane protein TolC
MKKYRFHAFQIQRMRVSLLTAPLLLFSSAAFAQIGAPAGQSQGTLATQLPLSGRAGQNGSVNAAQTTVPGTTTSINTLNPTIQVQGPFGGSANSTAAMPFSGKLSLREAVQRGLQYNLGAVDLAQAVRQAQGASRVARSALLPNLNGTASGTRETEDLRALGFNFNFPGFSIPTIIGPFNYMDVRAKLTQTVADLTAINNYRAAAETSRADALSARDARELVVLAVGGSYLEVIAAKARVESARAQLDTANALYQQALQQRGVGLLAQVDVNRSEVQALTQQQRLTSLENDLAKQKINLARLTGLPVTDAYEVSDDVPFSAAQPLTLDEALKQALDQRADLKAAEAQVRAAERARSASRDERLPSLSLSADYGAIGPNPSQLQGTYTVVGTLRVPIWQGGRTEGDIRESDAVLSQRRAELEDLKGQVQADVHNAYLDLQAAASQVEVSQKNLQVSRETLDLTRQRFQAGVTDSVEVVQTEQEVATAELDYINSVFAHNVAKLSLARAVGGAAANLEQFLKLP